MIITGQAKAACYLFIADAHVEIRDASHLWGCDIWQTTAAIRQELGDHAVQVAAIGPAGENYVDQISGERLADTYKLKNKSCFNCNIHCSRYVVMPDGLEGEGPEFETLCSYTSRIGNDNLEFALRMTHYLNRMGLDSLSSGETIGWAMECVQRGLLDRGDLDGMEFTWGNRRTIDSERRLNIDLGVDAEQDILPDRFQHEPLTKGPSRNQVVPVKQMAKDY